MEKDKLKVNYWCAYCGTKFSKELKQDEKGALIKGQKVFCVYCLACLKTKEFF